MDLQEKIKTLSPEQREKARALKTPEEVIAFAKEEGFDLSDDELEAVSGGTWTIPNCPNHS